MRVVMTTTSFPKFSGDSHAPWILELAKGAVARGVAVTVLAPSASDLASRDRFDGVEIRRFRYWWPRRYERVAYGANIVANLNGGWLPRLTFPVFLGSFSWNTLTMGRKANIVHAQFGYSGLVALPAMVARRKGCKFILSFYGRDVAHAAQHPRLYSRLFARGDAFLVLSEDMQQRLFRLGCPKEKLRLLHLGVDVNVFQRAQCSENGDGLTFTLVGNLIPKKGIAYGIKAFRKVVDAVPHARFRIIGQGPLLGDLSRLIQELRLEDHVTIINNYLHANPRETVVQALRQSDVFVLPSVEERGDYGGTPIVLMEASAMGVPCITTDDAGNSELVVDGVTGFVVKQRDVEALAGKMILLAEDHRHRQAMGEKAREHVVAHFNMERQLNELVAIYREVAEG